MSTRVAINGFGRVGRAAFRSAFESDADIEWVSRRRREPRADVTGAAKAIALVIPELAGRPHGYAVCAPIPTGSLVDLTIEASSETSAEHVNAIFRAHADTVLAFSEAPLVSSDNA